MRLIEILSHAAFVEWVFGIIVVVTCFLIYFRTRQFYELSVKHSGIKYFRRVFLYLGFTYIIRLLLTVTSIFPSRVFSVDIYTFIFSLGVYTSALTFFNLILMLFWKRLDYTFFSNVILIHLVSIVFAVLSIVKHHPYFLAVFHLGILIVLAIMTIETKLKKRKENSLPMMFLLYSMVFGHWVLISVLQFLSTFYPQVGIYIYLITFTFLVALIWKLLTHIGVNNETKNTSTRKRKT
jgi:hypothetical protein